MMVASERISKVLTVPWVSHERQKRRDTRATFLVATWSVSGY